MSMFVINKLTWRKAVELALEAGRIYGIKQHVFKHYLYGWTWRCVEEQG